MLLNYRMALKAFVNDFLNTRRRQRKMVVLIITHDDNDAIGFVAGVQYLLFQTSEQYQFIYHNYSHNGGEDFLDIPAKYGYVDLIIVGDLSHRVIKSNKPVIQILESNIADIQNNKNIPLKTKESLVNSIEKEIIKIKMEIFTKRTRFKNATKKFIIWQDHHSNEGIIEDEHLFSIFSSNTSSAGFFQETKAFGGVLDLISRYDTMSNIEPGIIEFKILLDTIYKYFKQLPIVQDITSKTIMGFEYFTISYIVTIIDRVNIGSYKDSELSLQEWVFVVADRINEEHPESDISKIVKESSFQVNEVVNIFNHAMELSLSLNDIGIKEPNIIVSYTDLTMQDETINLLVKKYGSYASKVCLDTANKPKTIIYRYPMKKQSAAHEGDSHPLATDTSDYVIYNYPIKEQTAISIRTNVPNLAKKIAIACGGDGHPLAAGTSDYVGVNKLLNAFE